MVIPIAHDFTCPWCWIGIQQVRQLRAEFGVTFEWLAYELFPDELELPGPSNVPKVTTNRPKTPSRLALAYAAQGMEKAPSRELIRTHNAHEAVELAKLHNKADEIVDHLYDAYWLEAANINDPDWLKDLCPTLGLDPNELKIVLQERRFADKIVGFDDPAYASGVFNVPTYWIGGQRYAEEPIQTLRKALIEANGGR